MDMKIQTKLVYNTSVILRLKTLHKLHRNPLGAVVLLQGLQRLSSKETKAFPQGETNDQIRRLCHVMTAYTGYGNLAHHMHKMSLEQAPSCPRCDNEDEDTKHFVAQCPAFVQERMATLGGSLLG